MAFRRQYIYDLSFLFHFLSYGRSRPQKRRLRMMMMIPWDTMFFPSLLIEPQLCNEAFPPRKKARRLLHFCFYFTSSVQRAGFACLLARRKPHGSNTCTLSRLPHTWNVPGPQATDRLLAYRDRAGRYLFQDESQRTEQTFFHLAFGDRLFSFLLPSAFPAVLAPNAFLRNVAE